MRVVLLNDTGHQDHFGCKLVMAAYERKFEELGVECTYVPLGDNWGNYRQQLDRADLVIVNAEGTVHHNKAKSLVSVAHHYPTAIINGVYQAITDRSIIDSFKAAKLVSCRESFSKAFMDSVGVKARCVPDVMLSLDVPRPTTPRFGLGMFDSVMQNRAHKAGATKGFIKAWGDDFLREAGAYHRWCTGRFHGICLAVLWDVPFSAYPSNTWKNEALMRDMGLSRFYADTWYLARRLCPTERQDTHRWLVRSRAEIDQLFEDVLKCAE